MIMNNEISILKNAGLSKLQIVKPIIFLAVICSLIGYLIAFCLMPMANKTLKMKKYDFKYNYTNILITPGIFEHLSGLTINVEKREGNSLSGILIYDDRNPEYSITITAVAGIIEKKGSSLFIHLNNGTIQRFNNKTNTTEILQFDDYVIDLNQNDKSDNNFIWKAREAYFNELLNYDQNMSAKYIAQYRVEVHKRITMPLFSLLLTLIAVSCLFKGTFNRRGNIKNILQAIFVAIIFAILSILIYDLMENSIKFAPLIYMHFVIFFIIPIHSLIKNKIT